MEQRELLDRVPEAIKKMSEFNVAIFGGALGGAILSTVLVRRFGWGPGMAIWAALMGLNLSKFGTGPMLCKRIMGVESLQDLPIEEVVARAIEAERVVVGATA
jgi:dipeptide/tripeptide permease